ncbi:MAG: T9SS type A sorting domain-containing protein, partial [Flavobacteriales bacterium]|nr:T9SS type A sorting domain-containing protein [Flavobacteriales bacterium]
GENGTVSEDCECVEPEPFAGCLDDEGFSPWPSNAITLECGGDSFSQSFAYASEYSLVDVLDGVTYSFSLSNEDYAVTIADEAGAAILTFGPGTGVDFTSDFDGVVRFYSHDPSDCALTGSATSHTRTVSATFDCPPAFDCPDLEANIGDDCELADGSNGAVDDDCNCVCASAGGTMSFNGNTNRVCAGTADAAIFEAALTGASGDNSIWVLTENQFILLDTDADGANFDFDALDEGGIYRVRHISYANGVDINDVLANPMTAGGCWESSNDIRVLPNPETGTISLLNESNEFCPGQGAASFAGLEVTGEDNTVGSRYVLADASGDVIQVRNQANFNLNNVAPGTYTAYRAVWTWISSYVPDPTAGLNVNDIGFCQALSNGIELTVNDCVAQASITSNPNPTPGESWVTFSVDQPQQVQIEVYDMAGRHIKTVFNQNAAGGQEYRMQFDGSGLPNGIYMYRMTTASEVLVDKFMIAR